MPRILYQENFQFINGTKNELIRIISEKQLPELKRRYEMSYYLFLQNGRRCMLPAVLTAISFLILVSSLQIHMIPSTYLHKINRIYLWEGHNTSWSPKPSLESFQNCSIDTLLSTGLPFLDLAS